MAQWTLKDFDTVCYSIQHNLMQLIKCVVDMSQEQSASAGQLEGLVEITGNIVDALNDIYTILSNMNGLLAIHEQRIHELEQKVG